MGAIKLKLVSSSPQVLNKSEPPSLETDFLVFLNRLVVLSCPTLAVLVSVSGNDTTSKKVKRTPLSPLSTEISPPETTVTPPPTVLFQPQNWSLPMLCLVI